MYNHIIDVEHTYKEAFAMCGCHSEIISFFSMARKDDPGYCLKCYATHFNKNIKNNPNEFYFKDADSARGFAKTLTAGEGDLYPNGVSFYDDSYTKRQTCLKISKDAVGYEIDRYTDNKGRDILWSIILSEEVAKQFAKEILKIIEEVETEKA